MFFAHWTEKGLFYSREKLNYFDLNFSLSKTIAEMITNTIFYEVTKVDDSWVSNYDFNSGNKYSQI